MDRVVRTAAHRCAEGLLRRIWSRGSGVQQGVRIARCAVESLEPRYLLSALPILTEFVALNNNGLQDENGDHSDWVEVFNPGSVDLNLNGYSLSDDPAALGKWHFPAVTVPSGGYLVVFADSKD